MRTIGNILWLALAGFWLAIGYTPAGLINLVYTITIPLGVANPKKADLALAPFGKRMVTFAEARAVAEPRPSAEQCEANSDNESAPLSTGTPAAFTGLRAAPAGLAAGGMRKKRRGRRGKGRPEQHGWDRVMAWRPRVG